MRIVTALAVFISLTIPAFAQDKGTTGLEMQKARADRVGTAGKAAE
jgi:hypothetical protein